MPLYCATVYYKDGPIQEVGYDLTLAYILERLWALPAPHDYVVFRWGRVVARGSVTNSNEQPYAVSIGLQTIVNQHE